MPPRSAPTERQKRLGNELRRIRTAAGMTAESAAGLLGVDPGKISNMESGVRAISVERLRTLACNCGCTDEDYVRALVEMTRRGARGWWEGYRGRLPHGFLDIAELEAHATRLRLATTVHIPGLLQTSEHALAVFRAVIPVLPEHEVALRMAFRAHRKELITEPGGPEFTAFVHEAALRMEFGGAKVARAQLHHLLDLSERDNVTVRVIPFRHGAFPGAGQTLLYADGPVPQLDTVQIDNAHGPDFLYADAQLAKYRAHLDGWERLAHGPDQSRDVIHAIARQL